MGRPRIYTLDENYFDSIDNPNKAYIIGFIYADGSINLKRNLLTICISEKDLEILEFIKKELNYSGIISSKKIKKNKCCLCPTGWSENNGCPFVCLFSCTALSCEKLV